MSVANLTVLGYVVLKKGWGASTLLLAPLVPLIEGYRAYSSAAFRRPGALLSREAAARADRGFVPLGSSTGVNGVEAGSGADGDRSAHIGLGAPPVWASFDPDLYRQPALERISGLPNDNGYLHDENASENHDDDSGDGGDAAGNNPRHLGDGAAIELMAGVPAHLLVQETSGSRQPGVTSPILQHPSQRQGLSASSSYRSIDNNPVLL